MSEYVLQLQIPVHLETPVPNLDDIQHGLKSNLRNWEEGRYGFYTELLHYALQKLLAAGVNRAIQNRAQQQYGWDPVPHGTGSTARWVPEAEVLERQVMAWLREDEITVRLTPLPDPPPQP